MGVGKKTKNFYYYLKACSSLQVNPIFLNTLLARNIATFSVFKVKWNLIFKWFYQRLSKQRYSYKNTTINKTKGITNTNQLSLTHFATNNHRKHDLAIQIPLKKKFPSFNFKTST